MSAEVAGTPARGARRGKKTEPAERATPASPRVGARRTMLGSISEIPNYLKLLAGLMTDRRVSSFDKLLVGGAVAYILLPFDLIPDFIPFFGQVDDVFVLVLALQRLIDNAGRAVVGDHWLGAPGDLSPETLREVLLASAFFLPRRLRRRLRRMVRG
ncbi:MAG: YkvA family protein [Gemmatimonadota bacterium]|nr:YkvA family protein [Gemmatimonadota bacterium]